MDLLSMTVMIVSSTLIETKTEFVPVIRTGVMLMMVQAELAHAMLENATTDVLMDVMDLKILTVTIV